jgi:hypothetical protein
VVVDFRETWVSLTENGIQLIVENRAIKMGILGRVKRSSQALWLGVVKNAQSPFSKKTTIDARPLFQQEVFLPELTQIDYGSHHQSVVRCPRCK